MSHGFAGRIVLISVVMAVLDRSGTVAGALDSVARQDHGEVECS